MPCCLCGVWVPDRDTGWSSSAVLDYSANPPRAVTWWWRHHKLCYSKILAFLAIRELTRFIDYTEEQAGAIVQLNSVIEDVANAPVEIPG